MTPEEEAVIEAAERWSDEFTATYFHSPFTNIALHNAVDSLRDSRKEQQ